jgi:ribose 5-phosphate isomerase B
MIALGCDHAAVNLKEEIKAWLEEKGVGCLDFGTFGCAKADYPIPAYKVGTAIAAGDCELGILLCGTGVGISIAANKVGGVRACCCSDPFSAKMSRAHNDANVLCMGARVIGPELAKLCIEVFLDTKFEGGRHQKRVDMIAQIESGAFEA